MAEDAADPPMPQDEAEAVPTPEAPAAVLSFREAAKSNDVDGMMTQLQEMGLTRDEELIFLETQVNQSFTNTAFVFSFALRAKYGRNTTRETIIR